MYDIKQVIDIFANLDEKGQDFAFDFLIKLSELRESERDKRNEIYLDKIHRGIKQCSEGRGIERDIIEVADDE